ncbi:unnamed protein product [Bursaphelenchus xylophilus]|uniref:Carboxypeptidase n=1 Tax=Bursaphelenchus xylophilus TaxID=6326 RepID=A0A1I7RRZ7_BURXY|nr:unnamed protein product [Bursaphelenchus xylophilus]CAG9123359.1 unnamed protein product [Bursaphelenchus xylophilus]
MLYQIGFFALIAGTVRAVGEEDRIIGLPNVTFDPTFNQYSGYLKASPDGKDLFFYWLTEAAVNSETAPLLIWLNGGPGCSSVGGLLAEYGPFYVTKDGNNLVENIFAWNREFNILFLESPIGVGFSYEVGDPLKYSIGDDETADLNFHALVDFFSRVQPRYRHRRWFLTGESYAGIYIPTLTELVLEAISEDRFPNPKFQGLAIGNGYLNSQNLTNSLIHWHVYHGAIGVREWSNIKHTCCPGLEHIEECNFHAHIRENSTQIWALDQCGKEFIDVLNMPENQNEYNYYLDCYKAGQIRSSRRSLKQNSLLFTNFINYDTTDNQMGFPCWNEDAMKVYMNKRKVQMALHVSDEWMRNRETEWETCNDDITDDYRPTYRDTFDLFKGIIDKLIKFRKKLPKNFRMLFFNGDVDTVCNFIGVSWHMDNVAHKNGFKAEKRSAWGFRNQVAGYIQKYKKELSKHNHISIDVLTVKGAGHFVSDRPGPALQMITNFVKGTGNYTRSDVVHKVLIDQTTNTGKQIFIDYCFVCIIFVLTVYF